MKECCANCNLRRDLWWWTYKEDGHLDKKEYGDCCILFVNEGKIMKIDGAEDGMCECFTPKKGGAQND